jgi:hypothetical protein
MLIPASSRPILGENARVKSDRRIGPERERFLGVLLGSASEQRKMPKKSKKSKKKHKK